jgi:hypothetical protein
MELLQTTLDERSVCSLSADGDKRATTMGVDCVSRCDDVIFMHTVVFVFKPGMGVLR